MHLVVHDPLNMFHRFGNFIILIKKLSSHDLIAVLYHTLSEGKIVVEWLAKLGGDSSKELLFLDITPPDLSSILFADALNIYFARD